MSLPLPFAETSFHVVQTCNVQNFRLTEGGTHRFITPRNPRPSICEFHVKIIDISPTVVLDGFHMILTYALVESMFLF